MTISNRFDPFGQLERVVSAKRLHWIIRAAALAVVLGFLVMRIRQYHGFLFKPLWAVETLLYVVLAIAFAMRSDPVDRSQGVAEIIVPLTGSVLPFALLTTEPGAWIRENQFLLTAVFCWMTLATGFTAWSIWTLRRSFSITVEARTLVTHRPYCWVRHPVYLGEILAAAAVVHLEFFRRSQRQIRIIMESPERMRASWLCRAEKVRQGLFSDFPRH